MQRLVGSSPAPLLSWMGMPVCDGNQMLVRYAHIAEAELPSGCFQGPSNANTIDVPNNLCPIELLSDDDFYCLAKF